MIVAIITIYNPNENVVNNALTISDQVDELYLCDNSPEPHKDMFNQINNATYCFMGANLALSGAFNYVLKNNSIGWTDDDFVIFFDQDSYIEAGHINALISEYN